MPQAPTDLTALGAMVVIALALVEALKAAMKALAGRYLKNGTTDPVALALTAQTEALKEHTRMLTGMADMLQDTHAESSEMYTWHERELEPGVKIWWNGPLMKLIEAMAESQAESTGQQEASQTEILSILEKVHENSKLNREDIVKILIHLKFANKKGNPLDTTGSS